MLLRTIATVIAVGAACILFPRSDADARGGGFHGGGMAAGFHMGGGHFGFQHGHPMMHADGHRDMHGRMYRGAGNHWDGRGRNGHFARADFGHWYRRSGFGTAARTPSIADGQWHAGGELP